MVDEDVLPVNCKTKTKQGITQKHYEEKSIAITQTFRKKIVKMKL